MTRDDIIATLEIIRLDFEKSFETQQLFTEVIDILKQPRVVYLCDGKACPECPKTECRHTFDVTHAVNFNTVCGGFYEEQTDEKVRPILEHDLTDLEGYVAFMNEHDLTLDQLETLWERWVSFNYMSRDYIKRNVRDGLEDE